jgi:hypothetical protein
MHGIRTKKRCNRVWVSVSAKSDVLIYSLCRLFCTFSTNYYTLFVIIAKGIRIVYNDRRYKDGKHGAVSAFQFCDVRHFFLLFIEIRYLRRQVTLICLPEQ